MSSVARPPLRQVTADDAAADAPSAPAGLALRVTVAVVGFGQVLLGLAQVAGVSVVDMVDGGHVGNESAAWNVSVGAALLGVCGAGRCSAAVFIMLTAFVAMLTIVTFSDALEGRVGPARTATHGLVLAGYLLVAVLRRRTSGSEPPVFGRQLHRLQPRGNRSSGRTR